MGPVDSGFGALREVSSSPAFRLPFHSMPQSVHTGGAQGHLPDLHSCEEGDN